VPGGTLLDVVPPGVLVTPFIVPVWFCGTTVGGDCVDWLVGRASPPPAFAPLALESPPAEAAIAVPDISNTAAPAQSSFLIFPLLLPHRDDAVRYGRKWRAIANVPHCIVKSRYRAPAKDGRMRMRVMPSLPRCFLAPPAQTIPRMAISQLCP
jgi:hypothetical protein